MGFTFVFLIVKSSYKVFFFVEFDIVLGVILKFLRKIH